ncbi:GALT5-like protein, partial [Mya arenaria]
MGLRLSPEDLQTYNSGLKNHSFNQFASDMISIHRSLPDARSKSCPRTYSTTLQQTSIIICFHNEAWSVLLRTVHSILDRSPPELVKEIILIDDFSNMDHLKAPLTYYMSLLGKVRVIRTRRREGLIRARLVGLGASRAPILTFLDSHVECWPGTLECSNTGNVTSNNTDETVVVAPTITFISSHIFSVTGGESGSVGIFKFPDVNFNWMPVPPRISKMRKSPADPIKTPTIAGGLFSINKDFFIRMGKYDEGMDIWGYENVEISLR